MRPSNENGKTRENVAQTPQTAEHAVFRLWYQTFPLFPECRMRYCRVKTFVNDSVKKSIESANPPQKIRFLYTPTPDYTIERFRRSLLAVIPCIDVRHDAGCSPQIYNKVYTFCHSLMGLVTSKCWNSVSQDALTCSDLHTNACGVRSQSHA